MKKFYEILTIKDIFKVVEIISEPEYIKNKESIDQNSLRVKELTEEEYIIKSRMLKNSSVID